MNPPAVPQRPAGPLDGLLSEIGPRWAEDIRAAGDATKAAYLPLLAAAPREGVEVVRDLAYGGHPRQRLDIYRPAGARRAPVIMFVHGGAFVRGAKDINGEMYGNVLIWFARRGFIGVNVEFRLAPEAAYPAATDDVAAACAWVYEHVQSHGGNPAAIALLGHSSGGTHVASYACDPALGYLGRHVQAVVLVSARLRADVLCENPNAAGVRAYYGDDPTLYERAAPMLHACHLRLPAFVVYTQYENPLLDLYAREFALRLDMCGRPPRELMLPVHNHVSVMAHFNSGEDFLGSQIVDFLASAGLCASAAGAS